MAMAIGLRQLWTFARLIIAGVAQSSSLISTKSTALEFVNENDS